MRTVITHTTADCKPGYEEYQISVQAVDGAIVAAAGRQLPDVMPEVAITALPQHVRVHLPMLLIGAEVTR